MPPSPTTPTLPDNTSPARGHDGTSPFPPDGPAPARDGGERLYVAVTAVLVVLPFAAGQPIGCARVYGLTALLRAGLVRIALLHHVARSVNLLCHVFGESTFRARRHDRAITPWPLAPFSIGKAPHILHHADLTSARHGVDRGQMDSSAAVTRSWNASARC